MDLQQKSKITHGKKFLTALLLLMVCTVLMISNTWGRYSSELKLTKPFQAAPLEALNLWGATKLEDGSEGNWQQLPDGWKATDKGLLLPFGVSNGTDAQNHARQPLAFQIQLAASLGVETAEAVTVTLTTENGESYIGQAQKIPEGSSFYYQFGPGWTYLFYDVEGNELHWELSADILQVWNAEILVQGVPDSSLLSLRVFTTLN